MTDTESAPKQPADPDTESIGRMFDCIAPVYENLNHILSFGQDFFWRRKLVDCVDKESKLRVLDLATGTGDILLLLLRRNSNITEAAGLDISENMLALCRKKIQRYKFSDRVKLIHADATINPFADETFDLVTMGFGIRNTPDIFRTLKEIHRLLRPGGKVLILEFSIPANPILKACYLLYLRRFLPFIGRLLSGDKHAYTYLKTSIMNFIRTDFTSVMHDAGFQNIHSNPLTFGIACLYQGLKPVYQLNPKIISTNINKHEVSP
jgi:demethylmenaquinone methyltransferase/2-methoxy-6-polyprenyl-1,4-benzoquinol methylase